VVVVPSPAPAVGLPPLTLAPGPVSVELPEPTQPTFSPPPLAGPDVFQMPAPGAPRALTSDTRYVYSGTDNTGSAPSQLVVFPRTGEPARQVTVTGQGSQHTGGLTAAAVHGTDLLVTDRSRGALLRIDPRSGAQAVLATIPDLPPCVVGIVGTCQPGVQDLPPSPEGLVVTSAYAYVTDAAQGTIWRYAFASKQLSAWYSSRDFAGGSGPSGLALDTSGNLLFTVGQATDPSALLKGALYRLPVGSGGAPGTRVLVTTFAQGSAPGPIAVGTAGETYVALRSAGGVVVVNRDGVVTPLVPAARIPAPSGISLAEGVLYVADEGKPATASSGRIVAVPVSDGPAT
jgi:hypothetical protein